MKNEDLMQSIDELDDKYIEEALDYKNKKNKKMIFVMAAAVLCIVVVCVYGVVRYNISAGNTGNMASNGVNNVVDNNTNSNLATDNNKVNEVAKSETIEVPKVNSGLVIIAKESQKVEKDTKMEKGVEMSFAEYGQWMSSLPAMPFSFEYNNDEIKDVSIKISCGDNGILKQYTVDNEGIWNVTFEGKSITCKPSKQVYWQCANLDDASKQNISEDVLTIEVINEDKVIEKRHVKIWFDEETWCFVGKLMD